MKRRLYSQEHELFAKAVKTFMDREVVPHQERWCEEGVVDRDTWRKAGEAGLLCPWLEEEYGGPGGDFLHSCIVAEQLSDVYESGFAMALHSDIIAPYIHEFGSDEQKRKWLPGCASGASVWRVCAGVSRG